MATLERSASAYDLLETVRQLLPQGNAAAEEEEWTELGGNEELQAVDSVEVASLDSESETEALPSETTG